MRLDELEFSEMGSEWKWAQPAEKVFVMLDPEIGVYHIEDWREFKPRGGPQRWMHLDAASAQAVLFHLFPPC